MTISRRPPDLKGPTNTPQGNALGKGKTEKNQALKGRDKL